MTIFNTLTQTQWMTTFDLETTKANVEKDVFVTRWLQKWRNVGKQIPYME